MNEYANKGNRHVPTLSAKQFCGLRSTSSCIDTANTSGMIVWLSPLVLRLACGARVKIARMCHFIEGDAHTWSRTTVPDEAASAILLHRQTDMDA